MPPLTLALPFIRAALPLIPLELHLKTPIWAQNPQQLMRLVVLTAMSWGIFMSTVQNMSVPTVTNMPLVTLNTVALETIVLFATALATPLATVWTTFAPSAMTQDMLLQIVPSQRTLVVGSSSTMGTWRESDLAPVVQVFEGGIVTIRGSGLICSILHLSPLISNSPFTFTISTMFFTDTYQYIIW